MRREPSLGMLAAALACALVAETAEAQVQEGAVITQAPDRKWYGWQTLAADGALLAMFDIGLLAKSSGVAVPAAVGFVLASPTVHVANSHASVTPISVSTHLLLPAAGYLITAFPIALARAHVELRTKTAIGLSIGGVAAAALDAAFFSWQPPLPNTITTTSRLQWQIAPWAPSDALGMGIAIVGVER